MKVHSIYFTDSSICWPPGWVLFLATASHRPLVRYIKLQVVHAPGMPGTVSLPPWVGDPNMHHGTCMRQLLWCMPGSLTSSFLWSQWQGKCSQHSMCMCNPPFLTRGQFWPSGIVVAWVCLCVRPSVRPCGNHLFVRAITQHPFKLGSPNLHHRCKRPWLRSLLFWGVIDLDLQGQI